MKLQTFDNREELYNAGLHNSWQKGIGKAKDGSGNMSIVLSGGYVDDRDFGSTIIYTGEGGRDPSTGKQVADQTITGGNKDLIKAFESNRQVYVTRGYKHKSEYSPSNGYELAGEYIISDHWIEEGEDGFDIVRFKLLSDLSPTDPEEPAAGGGNRRIRYTATRIVRETKIALEVKEIHDYECQICGNTIELPTGGRYAEGAHIKPLGRPHNGPDTLENLLCLCPNHHLMFDKYCYSINPETLKADGIVGALSTSDSHKIDKSFLEYHWHNYLKHKASSSE